jgi:hypothetical protein
MSDRPSGVSVILSGAAGVIPGEGSRAAELRVGEFGLELRVTRIPKNSEKGCPRAESNRRAVGHAEISMFSL